MFCEKPEPKRGTNGLPPQVSDRPVLDAATSRTHWGRRLVGTQAPPYAYVLASPAVDLEERGADT